MFFSLFSLCFSLKYAEPDLNKVEIQYSDTYEILETVNKPTNLRHIKEAHFTDQEIADDAYPWPGHPPKAEENLLSTEAYQAALHHCKASRDITQNDIYWHPAGSKQFSYDDSYFADSPRLKVRLFVNTKFNIYHPTGLYVPPGELITVEIPENAKNKINAVINRHESIQPSNEFRYKIVSCAGMQFKDTINNFGWHIGGELEISCELDEFPGGFEINISGVIEMPHYTYGVNQESEWNSTLGTKKAPLSYFNAGLVSAVFPTSLTPVLSKIDATLAFWNTMINIHYSYNDMYVYHRRKDGRKVGSLLYGFTSKVESQTLDHKEAVAYLYEGRVEALWLHVQEFLDFYKLYGTAFTMHHEMSHHFQKGWGYGAESKWREMTTDVQVFLDYGYMSYISGRRQSSYQNAFECPRYFWDYSIHQHMDITNSVYEKFNIIQFYNTFQYYFGAEKYREFLRAHIAQTYYKRSSTMPYINEMLLHACKIFKRDFRPYFKTFPMVFNYDSASDVNPDNDHLINEMNLQEFHPVSLLYQSGYVVDGVEFETARPYQIIGHEPYVFDLVGNMKSRPNMHSFTFSRIHGPAAERMIEISTGKYKYTPTTLIHDKFYVDYTDNENQAVTTCVVSIKQIFNGTKIYYNTYTSRNYLTSTNKLLAQKDSANTIIGLEPMAVPCLETHKNLRNQIFIAEGVYYPPKSGKYKFLFKHFYSCAVWFQATPLQGIYDDTKIFSGQNYHDFSNDHGSGYIQLTENQPYFYRIAVQFNRAQSPDPKVENPYVSTRYMLEGDDKIYRLEYERCLFNGCTLDDHDDAPFLPAIEKDPKNGIYYDDRNVFYNSKSFRIISHPTLANSETNLNKLLFNGEKEDANTRCTGSFPHTYKIDFNKSLNINSVLLVSNENAMNAQILIKCGDESVFTGNMNEKVFTAKFDFHKCQTIDVIVNSNANGDYSEFTEIQPCLLSSNSLNIIPATHSKFVVTGNGQLTTKGLYFNGKGFHLSEGDHLKFTVKLNSSGDSVGIIGDKSLSGGSFDVFVDGQFKSHVQTNSLSPSEKSSLSGLHFYQTPLFGVDGLQAGSTHTFDLLVNRGKVGINALLADGDLIDHQETAISSTAPTHTEAEDYESYEEPETTTNPQPPNQPEEPETGNQPGTGGQQGGSGSSGQSGSSGSDQGGSENSGNTSSGGQQGGSETGQPGGSDSGNTGSGGHEESSGSGQSGDSGSSESGNSGNTGSGGQQGSSGSGGQSGSGSESSGQGGDTGSSGGQTGDSGSGGQGDTESKDPNNPKPSKPEKPENPDESGKEKTKDTENPPTSAPTDKNDDKFLTSAKEEEAKRKKAIGIGVGVTVAVVVVAAAVAAFIILKIRSNSTPKNADSDSENGGFAV